MLGPRPTNPDVIRFSADCFEQVGTNETYVVVGSMLKSSPAEFSNRRDAEAYAAKIGSVVSVRTHPVLRRVRWY